MNLPDIRGGIAEVVNRIGIRTYDAIPENVEPPCAVVGLGSGIYDTDNDDGFAAEWSVLVLISRGDDVLAQKALDEYLSTDGDRSFPAEFRADPTLSGAVDGAKVVSWSEPQTYEIAQVSYVGVEIQVETIG